MRPMPCKGDAYSGRYEGKERSCYTCDHAAPEVRLDAPPPMGASGGKCAGFRGWELMVPAVADCDEGVLTVTLAIDDSKWRRVFGRWRERRKAKGARG